MHRLGNRHGFCSISRMLSRIITFSRVRMFNRVRKWSRQFERGDFFTTNISLCFYTILTDFDQSRYGRSYQNYVMIFKNPTTGQTYAAVPSLPPSIQYAPTPLIASAATHHHLPVAQPSIPPPYDGKPRFLHFFATIFGVQNCKSPNLQISHYL